MSERMDQQTQNAGIRLRDQKERVLQIWEERTRRTVPAAHALESQLLINSLPQFIDVLAENLSLGSRNFLMQEEEGELAREHGYERSLTPSYDLDQMIEEYQVLQKVLFEVLRQGGSVTAGEQDMILDSIAVGIRNASKEFNQLKNAQNQAYEKRLQQSEQRFRIVVEGVKDHAIVRTSSDGVIEDWNPGAENLTGWKRAEVLGKQGSIIFTPEDLAKDEDKKEMKTAREAGRAEDNRWHVRKDGSRIFVTGSMNPLRDAFGNVTGYVKVFRDYTENLSEQIKLVEKSEQAISSREEMYQLIMQAPVPMTLVSVPEHRFIIANPLYERMVGRNVTGKTVLEAFSKDEVGHFIPLLNSVYETGEPYIGTELPLSVPNGNGKFENRYINLVYHPFREADGKIKGIFAVVQDVTELVLARKRVEESEAWFKQLANGLPLIVWTATADGYVDWYNDWWYKYLGLPRGTKWDDPTTSPMHPEDVAKTNVLWPEAVKTGAPFFIEQRFRRGSDGEYRWHLVRGLPIRDESGQVVKYVGANTDIHEQKVLTEQLEKAKQSADSANQLKTTFLANMSHEIRTPIGVIQGFADLLAEEEIQGDQRTWVEIIRRNTRQLTSLIGEILDLSKVEADKLEIEKIPFRLRDIAEDLRATMTFKAEEKGLAFSVEVDPKLPEFILNDPTRLRQILINLAGNAIKFTQAGFVRVSFSQAPGNPEMLLVSVTDTGMGLTEEQKKKIFEPFVQADNSMTRRFGGTGLGLSISKKLALALGGSLSLVKSEPERGSTFELSLCCLQEQTELAHLSRKAVSNETTNLSGRRVLLVEDAPENRLLISHLLTSTHAEVVCEPNGRLGVERATREEFDVVLMDIQMPEMDGYHAIEYLRNIGYEKPVIALTAHALKEERERAMGLGFNDYLTKPILKKSLIAAIENCLKDS